MIPAFVIHHTSTTGREELCQDIVKKTGAIQFQSYLLNDRVLGCTYSHIGVAKLARSMCPDKHYLVFEDDCVLAEDWKYPIENFGDYDVLYIGYNDRCSDKIFGTHALYLSPKARDAIIDLAEKISHDQFKREPYDWLLSQLCREEGLSVCVPKLEMKEKWCAQKKGILSLITGQTRT